MVFGQQNPIPVDPFAVPGEVQEPPAGQSAAQKSRMVVEVVQVKSDSPVQRSTRVAWLDIDGKEAVERLCKTLNTRLSADFVNAPLDGAMELLSKRTGITIRIEQKQLEEAGVAIDRPCTCNFKDVTLQTILSTVTASLDLAYRIDAENIVSITTRWDVESRLPVRIYDCRDLIAWSAGHRLDQIANNPTLAHPNPIPSEQEAKKNNHRAAELIDLIKSCVEVDSWNDVGGRGAITNYYGLLLVSQTFEAHSRIERLLETLRSVATAGPAMGDVDVEKKTQPTGVVPVVGMREGKGQTVPGTGMSGGMFSVPDTKP